MRRRLRARGVTGLARVTRRVTGETLGRRRVTQTLRDGCGVTAVRRRVPCSGGDQGSVAALPGADPVTAHGRMCYGCRTDGSMVARPAGCQLCEALPCQLRGNQNGVRLISHLSMHCGS